MGILDGFLDNNRAYAETFDQGSLPAAPATGVAVLTCMDARIDIHKIMGLSEGDVHIIRNAGGVASDDALRSILISQRLLGTRAVALVHHTDCGMLKFEEEEVRTQIEQEVGEPLPFRLEAFSDLEQETRKAVLRIREAPFLSRTEEVRGFIYDVATGLLREVRVS